MAYIGKKPTAAPLTSSDVADGIITNAKLAQDIISGDTALAVAPADTDELLISDAGTLKRIDYSYLKSTPGWNLIKTLTASGDSTLSFVNGAADVVIDTTYNVYCFTFSYIHPQTLNAGFQFNLSDDTGSSYAVAKTSHSYRAWNQESSGNSGAPTDTTGMRLSGGTGVQLINETIGNDADEVCAGCLWIYNPGTATYVSMYESQSMIHHSSDYIYTHVVTGYAKTTSAIDAVQFSMSTGNIDAGEISLYGITK